MKHSTPMNRTTPRASANAGPPLRPPYGRKNGALSASSSTIVATTINVACQGDMPRLRSPLMPPAPATPPRLNKP